MKGALDRPGVTLALVAVALVVAIFAGQALAAASAPEGGVASTGRVLGRTSFAYLGGLRTFAAAVLWNRLDPIFDGYYNDRNVDEITMFLPTMRLVQILDPQFEQSYYNASFIIARHGKMDEAFAVARNGIENNPHSGLMLANYAQLLLMQDKKKNLPEMATLAKRGIEPDIVWSSPDDQFEGYGIFRTVFDLSGDKVTAARLKAAQDALRAQGATQSTDGHGSLPNSGNQ